MKTPARRIYSRCRALYTRIGYDEIYADRFDARNPFAASLHQNRASERERRNVAADRRGDLREFLARKPRPPDFIERHQRRGRIEGMEDRAGVKLLKATVPLGEMFGYSNAIRTGTQGRGSFTMIFKQYEAVPKNIASEVIEKRIKEGKVRPSAD